MVETCLTATMPLPKNALPRLEISKYTRIQYPQVIR
jgi:hypothetical protein